MASNEISAGKAFLELLVDDAKFKSGLDKGLKTLGDFGKSAIKIGASITAAGAAIVAPFAASLKIFADAGGALADMSVRTGLSAQSLTELKFAAEQTGTSLEVIEKAAMKMQKAGLDPNTFFDVAKGIAAIQDPVERAQAAMKVWGKSGTQLLPLLGNLEALRAKAHELGLVWSDEMVNKADRLGDAFDALKAQGEALAANIGSSVAPAVSTLFESLQGPLADIIKFVQENGELVAAIAALGVALVAIGTVMTAFGAAIVAVTVAIGAIYNPMTLLAIAIGGMVIAVADIARHMIEWEGVIKNVSSALKDMIGYLRLMNALKGVFEDPLNTWINNVPESHGAASSKAEVAAKEREAKRRADARRVFNNIVGNLPGSAQAAITGAALPPSVEDAFKQLGGLIGDISNAQAITVDKAKEKQKELIEKTAEDVADQFKAFGREIRGGTGGRFASQIGGMTAAESREEKMLDLEKDQLTVLNKVEAHLRKAQPLLVGNL